MVVLLIFLIIILVIGGGLGPILFVQYRKTAREQKNYERGLKFVPLFIHLPPPSDDIEVGGRDTRDVTEETISKAQTIYNIIASTFEKNFKRGFYGQRHFAFEIVATHGFVYFYAAVPISMLEVVKQAVVSAYPSAQLEEVAEHNIFNPVGKAAGVLGGELTLKEPFAYPIATYQDTKRDTLQALLNALSSLGKEDGVGIQLLMRPADPSWQKTATSLAKNKRKGGDKGLFSSDMAKSLAVAMVKPPEGGDGGGESKKPELSNLEQSTLDAIDEKTRHPGYETVIRLVVSSNVSQRAQAILANVVASFSLYDAPGRNGFKYTPAKDTEQLATDYIMRIMPPEHNRNILNSVELATLFHFPDQRNIPTSQLARQDSKQVDGPRNVPSEGLLLGYNVFRGARKPIRLSLHDRQRHMYVVGQTGVGKSTFLENLALQDMLNGGGFAFVDPHGDTAEKLLAMVPKERTEDVIYFSPADMAYPMGLNLFEFHDEDQKDFIIQEVLNMLKKLYDPNEQGIMGPRYEDMFRNAALAVMADPNGGTFIEIPLLFRDPQFLKQKLQYVTDTTVRNFWVKQFPAMQRSNEAGEVTAWFTSKFGAFLSNEMMRNIIGQTKSAFDMRDIMDNKKILIVNLSKGRTGDLNSKLLGMIFVMKFQAAAMSRANIPEDQRVDFSLYVDEFQNFSTESFATIMSEARKYHLNLIVANQFTTQLTDEIRDAVFGNMGTIIAFRVGQNDVEALTRYFQPIFDQDDLLRVPNYNTIVRTLIGGVPTQPFSMATLPSLGTPNPRLSDALKQLSAAKFGKPRAVVDKEIGKRLTTSERPAGSAMAGGLTSSPALRGGAAPGWAGAGTGAGADGVGGAGAMGAAGGTGPAAGGATRAGAGNSSYPGGVSKQGSFLDEWLSKRGSRPAPSVNTAPKASQPVATPSVAASPAVVPAANAVTSPSNPANPPSANVTTQAAVNIGDVSPKPRSAGPASGQKDIKQPAPTTKNISSDELARDEVDKIAAELKQELDNAKKPSRAKQPAPAKPVKKTEHEAELKPGKDDTIFIGRDGTFRQAPEQE